MSFFNLLEWYVDQGGGYKYDGDYKYDGYPSYLSFFKLQLHFTQSSSALIQICDSNNCSSRSYLEFKKKINSLHAI